MNEFKFFCERFFPHRISNPWTESQRRFLCAVEAAVAFGGLQMRTLPAGGGKTTLCECAALWAVLEKRLSFVVLVGERRANAKSMLHNVYGELAVNRRLGERFAGLADVRLRNGGTAIMLDKLGALIVCRGVHENFRGLSFRGQRPALAIVDNVDPPLAVMSDIVRLGGAVDDTPIALPYTVR